MIWYQGEANVGHNREIYDCTFVNMIAQWRSYWNDGTSGERESFPLDLFNWLTANLSPNWPVLR